MCRATFLIHLMTIERVITNQLPTVKSGSHTPVVPCELPNGIQLAYADDCDRRHTIARKDAGAIDFSRAQAFESRLPNGDSARLSCVA